MAPTWVGATVGFIGSGRVLVLLTVITIGWIPWIVMELTSGVVMQDARSVAILVLVQSILAAYLIVFILHAEEVKRVRRVSGNAEERDRLNRYQNNLEFLAVEVAEARTALGQALPKGYVTQSLRAELDDYFSNTSSTRATGPGSDTSRRT